MVILDEATSSLNHAMENRIYQAVFACFDKVDISK